MKHKNTTWIWLLMAGILLLLPALLLVWGFFLPPAYEETFLGELKYKYRRLEETTGPRIVVIGGSGAAFGVDSALLSSAFPGYTGVNFGMYAGLGTTAMLELSADSIRAGDLVILMPEQSPQTLSAYFNGDYMWQGADGAFSLLKGLDSSHGGQLLAAFPAFAGHKAYYALTEVPVPEDIYARASFDGAGDIRSAFSCANTMAGGYDPNTPIEFSPELWDPDFVERVNEWAAALAEKGAVVWYHFPPMNATAVTDAAAADDYCQWLQEQLCCQVIGNPHDSILEAGWFFDTNFHPNDAGRTVFTRQLIRDIKAVLGDTSPTTVELPDMPAMAAAAGAETASSGAESGDGGYASGNAGFFVYEELTDGLRITGLTPDGQLKTTLSVPREINGLPVTVLTGGAISGAGVLEEITLPDTLLLIEDNAFKDCSRLKEIRLTQTDPSRCRVGQNLLHGTNADIIVPEQALPRYLVNYFWSVYADRLK